MSNALKNTATEQTLNSPRLQTPFDRVVQMLRNARPIRSAKGGYSAQCPSHTDGANSLAIWEDETDQHVGLKCYAGCTRSAICSAWGITETDLYVQNSKQTKSKSSPKLTLFDFAADKMLHPHFLVNQGLHEDKTGIHITYYRPDGTEHTRYRIRTDLVAKKGSKWDTNSQDDLLPYGLQCLEDARKAKYIVCCEGETDWLTLRLHNIPAIGIPGAQLTSTIQPEHIRGIDKVFIIQEPDKAGSKFASDIRKRLVDIGYKRQIHTLDFQELTGAKDPNELHKKDIKAFPSALKAAMASVEPKRPQIQLLRDLQSQTLPDTKWAIPDIVPEGLTLLCGKPKLGKSWLLLALLIAVASGGEALGNVAVEQGEVLYISLEDNKRRLQKRTNIVNGNQVVSANFHYVTEWPRMNESGLEYLEEWIQEHPNVRLIGIDTWAKIKPKSRNNGQSYEEDYDAITPLQELAAKYQISIILVHHMRKAESEDPLDMVLGSTANTGAVDGFLLLYRKRGEDDARLFVTGRDIEEEQELLLNFDKDVATWKIKGDANDVTTAGTPQQQEILNTLARSEKGLTVKDLAEKLSKNVNTTRNLLCKLRNSGKVTLQNNVYSVVSHSNHSQSSNHSNHSKLDDFEVTIGVTQSSNHSNPYSNLLGEPAESIEGTFEDGVTTVTIDTTQNGLSLPKRLPKWLTPGSFEWDKLVARVGLKEANERRQAALTERG